MGSVWGRCLESELGVEPKLPLHPRMGRRQRRERRIQNRFSATKPAEATQRSVPRVGLNCSPTPNPKKNTTTANRNSRAWEAILTLVDVIARPA